MDLPFSSSPQLSQNPPSRKPTVTLKPDTGWTALNLRQLWLFRDLFLTLAVRDIKLRYRQTALGAIWVVCQPLMTAGIFAFIFGKVAKMPSEGVPYFIFAYAGLLAWNAFSSTLNKASSCMVSHAGLVSKVYFPRLVLPLSTMLSTLLDFAVASVVMVVLMIANQIVPGPQVLLLPIWLLLTLMLAVGFGLFAAALAVSYRDVAYILPVLISLLLYASPIAYPLNEALKNIPERFHIFVFLNPLSGLIPAFRWSLINTQPPHWGYVAISAVFCFVVLLGGAFTFKRMERRFADVI